MAEMGESALALDTRDSLRKFIQNEIDRLVPGPRWGTVLDINSVDNTAYVLFPGDTTAAQVSFSALHAPTRGLNTDSTVPFDPENIEANLAALAAGTASGDVVKVEGPGGNQWITDIANGIRTWTKTFVQDTMPGEERTEAGPYVPVIRVVNDTWIDTANGNTAYRWTGTAWVLVQDQAIVTAQSTADGKNTIFTQSATPTATKVNDVWIDTGHGNIVKTWSGSAWVSVQDQAIVTAQSTADGKNKIYVQGTAPSGGLVLNDTWIDTANGNAIKTWSGSAWVAKQFGTVAIAGGAITANEIAANTITAGKIVAGTITGNEIAANTVTAAKMVAGTITVASGIIGSLDAGKITTGTMTVASGGTTANFGPAGMSVVTGSTTVEATSTQFRVTNGTSTMTVDTTDGFKVVSGTTTVKANGSGFHVAAGTLLVDITTVGLTVENTGNFKVQVQSNNITIQDVAGGGVTTSISPTYVRVQGIYLAMKQHGTANISVSAANSGTLAVTFPTTYPASLPIPNVHLNIGVAASGIPRMWQVRALNITRSGFTLSFFSADSVSTTFSSQPVDWTAFGGPN